MFTVNFENPHEVLIKKNHSVLMHFWKHTLFALQWHLSVADDSQTQSFLTQLNCSRDNKWPSRSLSLSTANFRKIMNRDLYYQENWALIACSGLLTTFFFGFKFTPREPENLFLEEDLVTLLRRTKVGSFRLWSIAMLGYCWFWQWFSLLY